jgi:phosphatidylserine/phosphatidylglycerophosphate/cardiolipin synthase-like enzyme
MNKMKTRYRLTRRGIRGSVIFHPKLFLSEGKTTARLVIGSANMTFSGLHNNIEAGAVLDLDLTNKDDKQFLDVLVKTFDELPAQFPDHVFQIKDAAAADALFDDGRLMDEDIVRAPVVSAKLRKGNRDTLKAMKLVRHAAPYRKRASLKKKVVPGPAAAKPPVAVPIAVPAIPNPDFVLIWESRGLTERDLNIAPFRRLVSSRLRTTDRHSQKPIDRRDRFLPFS